MILLAEKRLKEKEGTHRTSVSVKCSKILAVPIWVTLANWPFGSLWGNIGYDGSIKRNRTNHMISTPMSLIHVCVLENAKTLDKTDSWQDEK